MVIHGGRLQKKQAFLFRLVDVAMELFAMAAVISRVKTMRDAGDPDAAKAEALADLFCRDAKRRVRVWFADLWRNDDDRKYRLAQQVLRGEHAWIEEGSHGLGIANAEPPRKEEVPARR